MQKRSILPAKWEVPEIFRRRLGSSAGQQRCMLADGHLLLVLHAPPGVDQEQREAVFFWRDAGGQWLSSDKQRGTAALTNFLNHFETAISKLEREEDDIHVSDDYFRLIEALQPVHRTVRHIFTVIQDARSQCPEYEDLIDIRDRAYELQRRAELLDGSLRNGLEFAVARRAEEQAKSASRMAVTAHRLNILVAFFFPMATLAALYGMNHDFHPIQFFQSFAFVTTVFLGFAIGILLMMFVSGPAEENGKTGKSKRALMEDEMRSKTREL